MVISGKYFLKAVFFVKPHHHVFSRTRRMPFDDFLTHFTEMSICRLINTSVFSLSKTWKETQLFGSWSLGRGSPDEGSSHVPHRAGGCLNHPESFLDNPQYRFDVADEDQVEPEIIVQLSQTDARSALLTDKKENVTIGFHIMQVSLFDMICCLFLRNLEFFINAFIIKFCGLFQNCVLSIKLTRLYQF